MMPAPTITTSTLLVIALLPALQSRTASLSLTIIAHYRRDDARLALEGATAGKTPHPGWTRVGHAFHAGLGPGSPGHETPGGRRAGAGRHLGIHGVRHRHGDRARDTPDRGPARGGD